MSKRINLINQINVNQPIKVYRNIRKKMFSVIDKSSLKLIGHYHALVLCDVEFKVSYKGRDRVRREKQKRVHAYVVGKYLSTSIDINTDHLKLVYYNPFVTDTFVIFEENVPIFHVDKCYLIDGKVYI